VDKKLNKQQTADKS